jgi:tRNA nucleotidyltransferase (CCA-adding enzyme)
MPDYNFLMETRLSPQHFQIVSQFSRWASEEGLNLYLAGGAVRDLTYGQHAIQGLDFVVEGSPQKILRHLSREGGSSRVGETPAAQVEWLHFDKRLNAAVFQFTNGVRGELAMCRSESYPRPGHPPVVAPAMIFDDLKRRDFSVNAMAISLHPNSRGLLLDPTNGAADIEKHELRVLHRASFTDDPLRVYRLFRLGRRLGFKPEEKTRNYLDAAFENGLWARLDAGPQGRELRAILAEEDPGAVLKLLGERGLLAGLDKKLVARKVPYEQFRKIRSAAQRVPGVDPYLVNFFCLVSKSGAGLRQRLARKVIPDRHALRMALSLEREGKKLARQLASGRASHPSQVYKILDGRPKVLLLHVLVYFPAAKVQERIKQFLHKAPLVRAAMPRGELLAQGSKPGPKFAKIVERLFLDQLDGKIRAHAQLLKEFRKLAGIPEPKPPAKPQPPAGKKKAVSHAAPPAAPHAATTRKAPPAKPSKRPARETKKPAGKKRPVKHKRKK